MTLRLPNDLREALELAVKQGCSASVTAEIIQRLRRSFELQPLNNSDPHELIKQYAATILDIVGKLEKKFHVKTSPKAPTKENSLEEQQLLNEFNQLPKHKRKMAISLFLTIVEMVKG
jgi:hypothetical protein